MARQGRPRAASAYERAVAYLARKDRTAREVRVLLEKDGWPGADIDAALERLVARRAVDDASLSYRRARQGLASGTAGPYRVRQQLRRRGARSGDVESGLAAALEEVPIDAAIDDLARREWSRRATEDPARRLIKVANLLLRRGFPATRVHARLSTLWPKGREVLDGLEDAGPDDGGEDGGPADR